LHKVLSVATAIGPITFKKYNLSFDMLSKDVIGHKTLAEALPFRISEAPSQNFGRLAML
jgi:hypothetical protein